MASVAVQSPHRSCGDPECGLLNQSHTRMITSNSRLDRPELAWRSNRQMRTNLMPPRTVLCRFASVQRGRQMTLEEIDKRILLRADLGQDDMIVAGLDV